MAKRKIYLLLTRFPGNGAIAIEALTGCYYSHTSIGLEEDLNTFYSIVAKGFIVESITRYVKHDRAPFPCQLYELEVSEKVYDRIKEILEYHVVHKGMVRYARLGLVMSLLRIPHKHTAYCYFCSEFVANVLQYSGAAELEKKSTCCFPDDLKRLPGMKLHFQGNLKTMIRHFELAPCLA